jgi:Cdc6-like AAA superfamily ATPase
MAERNENNARNRAESSNNVETDAPKEPMMSLRPPIPSSFRVVAGTPDSNGQEEEEDAGMEETFLEGRRSLDFGGFDDEDGEGDGSEDDDESSLSSASSSSSSSSEEEQEDDEKERNLTLQEKVTKNQQRNALFLQTLNKKYQDQVPTIAKRKYKKKNAEILEEPETNTPRGMLRPKVNLKLESEDDSSSSLGLPERMHILMERYPNREPQIRRLASLLHATIGQVVVGAATAAATAATTANLVHVPSPVFVMGPRGVGKTSVVQDVVDTLEQHAKQQQRQQDATSSRGVFSAYINCVTLEPSSIERLVTDAYNQLRPEEYARLHQRQRRTLQKRKRQRNSDRAAPEGISKNETDDPSKEPFDAHQHSHKASVVDAPSAALDPNQSLEKLEDLTPKTLSSSDSHSVTVAEEVHLETNQQDGGMEDLDEDRRVQPRRAVKIVTESGTAKDSPAPSPSPHQGAGGDSVETSHSAVVAFGRSLQPFYGVGTKRCAILILDHAERLLSLSAKKKPSEKTNCLAELLLLPKVMKVNLAIIIITNHSILHGSRKYPKSLVRTLYCGRPCWQYCMTHYPLCSLLQG